MTIYRLPWGCIKFNKWKTVCALMVNNNSTFQDDHVNIQFISSLLLKH